MLSREVLEKLYLVDRKSSCMIAKELGVADATVLSAMRRLGIPRRSIAEAKRPKGSRNRPGTGWCHVCKDDRPTDEFCKNRRNRSGLNDTCKLCAAKAAKKNKWGPRRRQLYKAEILMRFGNKCRRCGVEDIPMAAFHFHHKESGKQATIGESMGTRSVVEAELKLCELLCANCHCAEHYPETANEVLKKNHSG